MFRKRSPAAQRSSLALLWTASWAPYLAHSLRHTKDSRAAVDSATEEELFFSFPRSTGLGERSILLSQGSPGAQAEGPGTAESSGWARGPRVAYAGGGAVRAREGVVPCWGKEGSGDVGWGQKREGKEEAGVEATSLAPLAPRPGDQYRLRNLCSSIRTVMTRRSKMSSAISTTDSTEEPNHRLHWLPRLDRRLTICREKEAPASLPSQQPVHPGGQMGLPTVQGQLLLIIPHRKNGHEPCRNWGASQGPFPSCLSHVRASHYQTSHPRCLSLMTSPYPRLNFLFLIFYLSDKPF